MSTRQALTDDQKKQEKLNTQRAEEFTQAYKGPVLSQLATFNQILPNIIDNLIKECLVLYQKVDTLTSENQKVNGELATLKAVSKAKPVNDVKLNTEPHPTYPPKSTPELIPNVKIPPDQVPKLTRK